MSKGLDDIDKIKHPFKVEDRYFDDLTVLASPGHSMRITQYGREERLLR